MKGEEKMIILSNLKHEMNRKYMSVYRLKWASISYGYKMPYMYYHNMLEDYLDGMTCTACYIDEMSMDEFNALLHYKRMLIERFDEKFPDEE